MTSIEQQQTTSEILSRRARYVSAGVSTPRLVVSSAEGARVTDPEGRVFVDFAGGNRLPEHGPPIWPRRRGDPPTGRPLSPSVLHGRRLRAVRRDVPAARGAVGLRRREPEVDPRQLGCRGGGERGEDRAHGNRPPRRDRVRPGVPRADAADDDDDEQGAPVQGGLRAVRARGLPCARALPVPRHHHGGRARRPREALQVRRRPEDGRVRGARAGPGRGRLRADDARFPRPAGRGVPGTRDPLRRRRGAVRRGAHGQGLGDRALRGGRARPARLRQVDRRRAAPRGRHRSAPS